MHRVIANIKFLRADEGGRTQSVPVMDFGCPVFFVDVSKLAEHGYDARLLVREYGRPIAPGDSVEGIGLVFLSPEEVLPNIIPGNRFTLWEGKTIARGTIVGAE